MSASTTLRRKRAIFAAIETLESRRLLTTFTVTSTGDTASAIGTFAANPTLRQAILEANANAGADTVAFDISGSGVHTIAPVTALPAITDALTIDGYTQSGATANMLATGNNAKLLIELSGASAPAADGVESRHGELHPARIDREQLEVRVSGWLADPGNGRQPDPAGRTDCHPDRRQLDRRELGRNGGGGEL